MHRTILEIGFFRIQSYGLMLALGFLIGGLLLLRAARKRSINEDLIINLIYVIVISSVVGARGMYVLTHLSEYKADPVGVFKIWEGGLTLYGGLLLAVVASVAYMKRVGLPLWVVCDIAAPSIALGKVFTRIGCFLNGCCFGVPTGLPWGIQFPLSCQAGSVFPGERVHPTELYSAGLSLIVFVILLAMGRKARAAGTVFWSFLLMDSGVRFALGFVRYTEPSSRAFELFGLTFNFNQVIAALLAAVSVVVLLRLRPRQP
jgi:phosphatidylglycerol:prolipoprotein diacylglycerol transferase